MVKYNEIKDETALRRMTDLVRSRSISFEPWADPEKYHEMFRAVRKSGGESVTQEKLPQEHIDESLGALKEIQGILEEIGEPTIKEWAIALLEYAHNHSWDLGRGRSKKMHHTALIKDLKHLGDVLARWVKDQAEIRTPPEDPQYYTLPKDEDGAWIYPPEVTGNIKDGPRLQEASKRVFELQEERKEEKRSDAEHNRLREPARERARIAILKLTPEQERAWLFGRFYPYPGPYAGQGIEYFAFGEAYLQKKEAENAESQEKFVAGLTTERLRTWGLDGGWILPPLHLLTLKMRRRLLSLLLTPLTDAHRDSHVSFSRLIQARLKQAVENGELTEPSKEKVD